MHKAIVSTFRKEYAYFNKMTTYSVAGKLSALIMGKNTWNEIMPYVDQFTKNRIVVIVSRTMVTSPGIYICQSYDEAIRLLTSKPLVDMVYRIWNVGGSQLYAEGLRHLSFHRLYLTRIKAYFECDVHFPNVHWSSLKEVDDPSVPKGIQEENGIEYEIHVFEKIHNDSILL